jgi:hypothetical protein
MPVRIDTNNPSVRVIIVSLVLAIIAILGHIARIPYITPQHFWIAVVAYAVLLAGTLYKI